MNTAVCKPAISTGTDSDSDSDSDRGSGAHQMLLCSSVSTLKRNLASRFGVDV